MNVDEAVTVAGKQLPAGKYQVEWAGTGPSVELSISDGRETVPKVPAQILPLAKAEAGSGYSTATDQTGQKALTGIFFRRKRNQLPIRDAPAPPAPPSPTPQPHHHTCH